MLLSATSREYFSDLVSLSSITLAEKRNVLKFKDFYGELLACLYSLVSELELCRVDMGEQGLGMSRLYSLPWRRKQNSNINVDTKRLHTATASACHNAYAMPISYGMKQPKRQKSLRIQVRSQRD